MLAHSKGTSLSLTSLSFVQGIIQQLLPSKKYLLERGSDYLLWFSVLNAWLGNGEPLFKHSFYQKFKIQRVSPGAQFRALSFFRTRLQPRVISAERSGTDILSAHLALSGLLLFFPLCCH